MVSYSDALKMMQGGEDRTGYADMIDTLGQPGDLLAQRRAEAEQRRSLMELLSSQGGDEIIGGDITGGNVLGSIVPDDTGTIETISDNQLMSGSVTKDPYALNLDDEYIYEADAQQQAFDDLSNFVNPDNIETALQIGALGVPGIIAGHGMNAIRNPIPDSMDAVDDPVYSDALDSSGFFNQDSLDRQRQINDAFENGTEFPYWYNEMDHEGSIAGEYLADGGRVGMQQGGMPAPALLGVSSGSLGFGGGQQNMANFQDAMYRPPLNRPPMRGDPDFVSGPGFGMQPTPMPFPVGPFKPMPFQPSPMQTADFDFGDYLGGSDPFAADYDPYVNATGTGAYDQYGMGMTQEDINKVFADTDKFSLAAQEAKRKAEEEAKKKTVPKERGGHAGEGGGPSGGGSKSCFVEGTPVEMADGTTKEITNIKVGDETRGGIVEVTMQCLPARIYNYKDVLVSGSHWVIEDNQFVAVEDSKHGVLTDRIEPVYTLKTSKNRIWIYGIEFGDFETGSDEDWEPHFEAVRQKLNKQLDEKTH